MEVKPYGLEDVRGFLVKRQWLVERFMSPQEFESLKDRTLLLTKERSDYVRAFADGWTAAKP